MKKNILFFSFVIILLFISATYFKNNFNSEFKSYSNDDLYRVYALKTPENISFCDEQVPLELLDVRERLDRELLVNTYWQSNMLLLIKRSYRFFPLIEEILKEEEVPDDFKYLAVIESGLENVRSPKGAKGIWQIMSGTAREYGLEVNKNVDERYNLELSTRVACKYLKKAKNKFGSWTLAAAAYNRGISGISRNLTRQKVENYYDLLLGRETSRYIFRILAVKEIMENANNYGFIFQEKDLYKPYEIKKIELDTAISNITDFSKKMGINYKTMKLHNPWLLENHLNNKSRKKYIIKIPN
ncbi:MAG: murein transglycosylase [Flavobacteriaceae bacterium]|nr:murein transglycosylase [Flavobacteriaceae bacterium]